VANDARAPLAETADIIKVDLLLTTEAQREALVKQYGPWRCRMLAEKGETQTDFFLARDQGFVYFQGYFLPPAGDAEHARHAGQSFELPGACSRRFRGRTWMWRNSRRSSSQKPPSAIGCCAT